MLRWNFLRRCVNNGKPTAAASGRASFHQRSVAIDSAPSLAHASTDYASGNSGNGGVEDDMVFAATRRGAARFGSGIAQQPASSAAAGVVGASSSPAVDPLAVAKSRLRSQMPESVQAMSDAEFEENVKLLQTIATKSIRSFVVLILGIFALWYARRKKATELESAVGGEGGQQQQQDATASAEVVGSSSDGAATTDGDKKKKKPPQPLDELEAAFKDIPGAQKYIQEMRGAQIEEDEEAKK